MKFCRFVFLIPLIFSLLATSSGAAGFVAASGHQRSLQLCTAETIFDGQGAVCLTITVTNLSLANPPCNQKVTVTYANGSTVTKDLKNGESHTFSCNITKIEVHETVRDSSLVGWTIH
jgi:hypothetical protein